MLLPEGAPIAPDGYDVGKHSGLRCWYSIQVSLHFYLKDLSGLTTRPTGNNNVRELFQEIIRELATGETAALATIVKRKGSVPREVGAKMLVRRGGKMSGTVGGGCG